MDDGMVVRRVDGAAGLYVTRAWKAAERLLALDGISQGYPSRYSIQVAATEHLVPPLRAIADGDIEDYYRWCFLNHGCAPTVRIDTGARAVVALTALAPGDELRFDYDTTEWNMADPFACTCGAPTCRHRIGGYKHLTEAQRRALAPLAAPHLATLLRDLDPPDADAPTG